MAPISLKKSIQQYKSLAQRIEAKIRQLKSKRDELESRAFVVIDDTPSPTVQNHHALHQSLAAAVTVGAGVARKSSNGEPPLRSKSPSSPPTFESAAAGDAVERDSSAATNVGAPLKTGNAALVLSVNQADTWRERSSAAISTETTHHLVEERVMAHGSDVASLVSAATNILIESMQLKLSYVQDVLAKLTEIQNDKTMKRVPTPPELLFSRYEEWVQRNQRLIELNVQLYDLEKLKFELKEKRSKVQSMPRSEVEVERALSGSQFVHSSVQRIQAFFSHLQFTTSTSQRTRAFITELLDPKGDRLTLEAQKVNEYVTQCLQMPATGAACVEAAGPDCYRQFMAVLCGYIVEKQQEVQGEDLPFDLVYSTVERHVIPKILPAILKHVAQPERDQKIQLQCERFKDVTLSQLRVKPSLQSEELVPFIDSVTQLRASYFTPTPTGKMYAVVAAAKALYEQLGEMGESSIDGDSFLDLWIYVIIKAGIKDLATNLRFMEGYGNPRLSMDEAGYYLTTLEAAATFIEHLKPEDLRDQDLSEFVVCECDRFKELSSLAGSCIEIVAERQELEGFKVAVLKDWALDRTRLFRAVLLSTGDANDIATVSVIRFSAEHSNGAHIEYFSKKLTEPHHDCEGLKSTATPLGLSVTADISNLDPRSLITLPTGDYDMHKDRVSYFVQLMRLGCEYRDISCEMIDLPSSVPNQKDEYVYVRSPPENSYLSAAVDHHRNVSMIEQSGESSIPLSTVSAQPSLLGSIRGKLSQSLRRSRSKSPQPEGVVLPRPTSPYLLSQSSNRGHNIEVSLDTFPSKSPLKREEETEQSPARKVWALFQWRKKKKKSPVHKRTSLPSFNPPEETNPVVANNNYKSNTLDFGVTLHDGGGYGDHEEDSVRSTSRRSTFDNSQSYPIFATDGQPNNVVTVEVEVHDMDASLEMNAESPVHQYHTRSSSRNSSTKGANSPKPGVKKEFLSLPEATQKSHQKRRKILTFGTSRDHSHKNRQQRGVSCDDLKVPLLLDHTSGEFDMCEESIETESRESLVSSLRTSSFIEEESFTDLMVDCFSEETTQTLEQNFMKDHLFTGEPTHLKEAVTSTVRQGQLYLQRLNFLSTTHALDGVFTNTTLDSVRNFQVAHNAHESKYSVFLPENGHLTAATLQYLRQAFFTVYASLLRLGYEPECGDSFNPTSCSVPNVTAFFNCVKKFQQDVQLPLLYQDGVMNELTIKKIKQTVRFMKRTGTVA